MHGPWSSIAKSSKLAFFICSFCQLMAVKLAASESKISLNAQQVPIALVLKCLAQLEKKSFLELEVVAKPICLSAWLVQQPWRGAVDRCLAQHQLRLKEDEAVWSIESQSCLLNKDKTSKGSDLALEEQLEWHYFQLHHLDVTTVGAILREHKGILSSIGSMHLLKLTNTLLLRERRARVAALKNLLSKLDVPTPQVQIEARIVSASEEALEELGFHWKLGHTDQPMRTASFNHVQFQKGGLSSGYILPFSPVSLDLELAALQSENRLTIVAAPTLRTTACTTASIKQGTEMPYRTFQSKDVSGQEPITILFKEAVLSLEVTPRLLSKNRLMLAVQLSHNTPGHNLSAGEDLGNSINKQEIKTEVQVNSGETIVLGGIFQGAIDQQRKGIPFLSTLPWVGRFFSYQLQTHQQRELLIFLTPKLVGYDDDLGHGTRVD